MSPDEKNEIVQQAIDWLVRLQEGNLSEQERQQFINWQQKSPAHQRVWEKVLKLQQKISGLPTDLVLPVMDKVQASHQRDNKKYVWLLIFPILGGLYLGNEQQQWFADYRSVVGERKTIELPDGGKIILNGRSAIDVEYSDKQREIVLRKGQIWIETHHDNLKRPFFVTTKQGTAQALGTQYLVKTNQDDSYVAVAQGEVKVTTQYGQQQIIKLNQQAHFNKQNIQNIKDFDRSQIAWTKGFIIVDELPFKDFVEQLRPYQKGVLKLEPELEQVKVSGTYPIDKPEKVYAMLAQIYALEIDYYASGYWTVIRKKK